MNNVTNKLFGILLATLVAQTAFAAAGANSSTGAGSGGGDNGTLPPFTWADVQPETTAGLDPFHKILVLYQRGTQPSPEEYAKSTWTNGYVIMPDGKEDYGFIAPPVIFDDTKPVEVGVDKNFGPLAESDNNGSQPATNYSVCMGEYGSTCSVKGKFWLSQNSVLAVFNGSIGAADRNVNFRVTEVTLNSGEKREVMIAAEGVDPAGNCTNPQNGCEISYWMTKVGQKKPQKHFHLF